MDLDGGSTVYSRLQIRVRPESLEGRYYLRNTSELTSITQVGFLKAFNIFVNINETYRSLTDLWQLVEYHDSDSIFQLVEPATPASLSKEVVKSVHEEGEYENTTFVYNI